MMKSHCERFFLYNSVCIFSLKVSISLILTFCFDNAMAAIYVAVYFKLYIERFSIRGVMDSKI